MMVYPFQLKDGGLFKGLSGELMRRAGELCSLTLNSLLFDINFVRNNFITLLFQCVA